jgi:CAP-Gly domain-containing linker protein 1
VQELTQDHQQAQAQIKTLEAENRLLTSEMEQLREELRQLEDNLEQSILREEHALASGTLPSPPASVAPLPGQATDVPKLEVRAGWDAEQREDA